MSRRFSRFQFSKKGILATLAAFALTIAFATLSATRARARFGLPGLRTPAIISIAPHTVPPGTEITIRGRNLGGAIAVRFNNANARFRVIRGDMILAIVPPNTGRGPIRVTILTRAGTANGVLWANVREGGGVVINRASRFAGRPGDQVAIFGDKLLGVQRVLFTGGAEARFLRVSSRQLMVIVPPGAMSGPIRVEGTSGISTSRFFFQVRRR